MTELSTRKKILFSLIVLLILALAGEGMARGAFAILVGPRVLFYGTEAFTDARAIPTAVMARVGYAPPTPDAPVATYMKFAPHETKFDTDENGERFSPTINSRGFRGPEFTEEKAPGVIRVVTLGSSSTFGYHDRDDETYPHYLGQILNGENGGGQAFEVINLGIPHIQTHQLVSLFVAEALPLEPDVVTVYTGLNDSGKGLLQVVERRQGFGGTYEFLRQRLLTIAFFDSFLYYAGVRGFTREDLQNLEAQTSRDFIANLEAIRAECEKRGIAFVVSTQQASANTLGREKLSEVTYADEADLLRARLEAGPVKRRELTFLIHTRLMRDLRAWAEENDVPLVDIIAALDDDRSVLLTYVHLSPAGNRKVARAFAEVILGRLSQAVPR